MAQTTPQTPDQHSCDYEAMLPYWQQVSDILEGVEAMRCAAGVGVPSPYLPKFPNETQVDYDYRRQNAKFTNIYGDIVANLAQKPFSEEVSLKDGASARIKKLAEDIDGRGNGLNVFAGEVFFGGINAAVDWILVDFTKARPRTDGAPLSLADEKAQGLRPYWVRIPAIRMIAIYSAVIQGREVFTHARMRETTTSRDGFAEVTTERIRVFDRAPIYDEFGTVIAYQPATFEVWEQRLVAGRRAKSTWVSVESGPVSIGVIPLVPFITGRRKGGSWRFIPPMKAAADLQVEHFQQETALKAIKEMTAFPMLAANGVAPAIEDGKPKPLTTGPKAVLYAPPAGDTGAHGEWTFIEPSAESLRFLADDVKNTEQQLRELGRQPLTAQTGNLTVVTTAFAAQKGNSACQAWAFGLKDTLEQALVLTAMWLGEPEGAEVVVFTDFDVGMDDDKGPDTLLQARKNGDLSRRTFWSELKRRSILSADFNADDEEKALEEELPGDPTAEDAGAALGPNSPPQQQAA